MSEKYSFFYLFLFRKIYEKYRKIRKMIGRYKKKTYKKKMRKEKRNKLAKFYKLIKNKE